MAGGRIDILVAPELTGFNSKLASGLRGTTGIAGKVGKGIALALAAGTAIAGFGLGAIIDKGKEYQANLNELQAVTQATGVKMAQVSNVAKQLGSDMSLPATSAADAAAAMLALSKGGLSVDQAMKAAKGTLQLAAAAQVDGAEAAEIQSSALNAFRLNADQAGRVADVLANTANAAAGSITDIANSMKFVAPVSAAMGISIEHTAAAIGLLANQGIKGEQAGTSLRGILASLASPSAAAAKALKTLGVVAFDNQGKFVGLRTFTDQLAKAKGRLSDATFAAATSTAFGNEGFTAANALASEGATSFDQMATAVGRAGGAADVAAAKTKGLGGAVEGFKSQVETAGIGIFEKIAPTLEKGVRAAADVVAKITPAVVSGIDKAVAVGQLFSPKLAAALKDRASTVVSAAQDVLRPLAESIPGLLNQAVNTAIELSGNIGDVFSNVVAAAKPAAKGIADVAKSSVQAGGPLSALGTGVALLGDALGAASGILIPIGKLIGGIASAFASLPGPVQSAVIALGLAAALKGPLGSLGDTVKNRVTAPFKSMGEEIRLQGALLTGSTNIMSAQIGKVGLAMAALESRIPAVGRIAEAYRNVSTATEGAIRGQGAIVATSLAIKGASEGTVGAVEKASGALGKLAGVATGTGAALGSGLKSAAGGLVGFLGGPWGVAIAAAGVGLSLLASKQQRAAAATAEHEAKERQLGQTLEKTSGSVTDATREFVSSELAQRGIAKVADRLGVSFADVVDAALSVPGAMERVRESAATVATAGTEGASAYAVLSSAINIAKGTVKGAADANREVASATEHSSVVTEELAGKMRILGDSTSSADDKARALKESLDILAGGNIGLEAAQARLNDQMARLADKFGENADKTKGWGKELINLDGSVNTTTENGQALFQGIQDISGSMIEVAQRTFDASKQTDGLPVALGKAAASAQATRDAFIQQAHQMGILGQDAEDLADKYGLIPSLVATAITTPFMSDAQKELVVLNQKIQAIPPGKTVVVKSLTEEAKRQLEGIGFTVVNLPDGTVSVTAQTGAAKANFEALIRDISNRSVSVKVVPFATAIKGQFGLAKGGVLAKAYADGGFNDVTPMRGGVAQIVPPNSWRIIGDRMVDDEAYIPINQSARSLALLEETARRMNVSVIRRFATGAVTGQGSAQVQANGPLTIENHIEIGGEVVRVVRTQISESNRETRRRVLAGVGAGL